MEMMHIFTKMYIYRRNNSTENVFVAPQFQGEFSLIARDNQSVEVLSDPLRWQKQLFNSSHTHTHNL